MLKFALSLTVWLFAVSGYLYLYDEKPQVALIIGVAVLVLFVGLTLERKK
jgi:hypothetical protein